MDFTVSTNVIIWCSTFPVQFLFEVNRMGDSTKTAFVVGIFAYTLLCMFVHAACVCTCVRALVCTYKYTYTGINMCVVCSWCLKITPLALQAFGVGIAFYFQY